MSGVSKPGADAVGIDRVGADAVGAVVERILAHQGERRRFGDAVGTEIRPRIDRLLRDIEQQTAAGALRQHDFHRGLRDALVAVEIQLETLAHDVFGDVADAALPGRAGIRHHDVDAAEMFRPILSKAVRTDCGVGHVAGDRQRGRADACRPARARRQNSRRAARLRRRPRRKPAPSPRRWRRRRR